MKLLITAYIEFSLGVTLLCLVTAKWEYSTVQYDGD
jgi:hypothetical protein